MPKQNFTIRKGAGQSVEVEWDGVWKNARVSLEGQQLGSFADQKELRNGKTFITPMGGNLFIRLKQGLSPGLEATYDGEPLGGAINDPETRWRNGYMMIFALGGLNIIIGTLVLLFNIEFLRMFGIGEYSILFGFIMLALGYWSRQTRSTIALVLAVLLFGGDGILTFFSLASAGMSPNFGGLVARIFLLLPILQAIPATMQLNDGKLR